MLRILKAIKKYLFKDTKYFFLYILRYFQPRYKHNCNFYSTDELIENIKNGKSLIRIGDGEIGLLHYLPIHYQKWSRDIRNDFLKIIKNYNENSPYLLGIPLFVNYSNTELRKIKKLNCWIPLKVTYESIFNKYCKYVDAHVFYKNLFNEKKYLICYLAKKLF